ncbi:hypothetical protein TYRP_016807 [Tyrophagus putrescentiae]|nr:hypothetical protein TYRP_016807 [Tyrophagus putrescentiae]
MLTPDKQHLLSNRSNGSRRLAGRPLSGGGRHQPLLFIIKVPHVAEGLLLQGGQSTVVLPFPHFVRVSTAPSLQQRQAQVTDAHVLQTAALGGGGEEALAVATGKLVAVGVQQLVPGQRAPVLEGKAALGAPVLVVGHRLVTVDVNAVVGGVLAALLGAHVPPLDVPLCVVLHQLLVGVEVRFKAQAAGEALIEGARLVHRADVPLQVVLGKAAAAEEALAGVGNAMHLAQVLRYQVGNVECAAAGATVPVAGVKKARAAVEGALNVKGDDQRRLALAGGVAQLKGLVLLLLLLLLFLLLVGVATLYSGGFISRPAVLDVLKAWMKLHEASQIWIGFAFGKNLLNIVCLLQ